MRIVQLLTCLFNGDGVGNDAIEIDRILKENSIETKIYAGTIGPEIDVGMADVATNFPVLEEEDVIIFHFSIGTQLCALIRATKARVVMIYHNITPAHFFHEYNSELEELCVLGRQQLREIRHCIDYCLADSEFNKKELQELGYQCPIEIQPIIIPFFQYKKKMSKKILKEYKDNKKNWLFVGRISPNKRQEDILEAFRYYKEKEPDSRLILLGGYNEDDRYYLELERYVREYSLEDVVFTGHVDFDEILSFYSIADIFVCMSEHEGFCIPLLEAMSFDIPILAYDSTAVTETIGGASVVIRDKEPRYVAAWAEYMLKNQEMSEDIVRRQRDRLKYFSYKKTSSEFWDKLKKYIG